MELNRLKNAFYELGAARGFEGRAVQSNSYPRLRVVRRTELDQAIDLKVDLGEDGWFLEEYTASLTCSLSSHSSKYLPEERSWAYMTTFIAKKVPLSAAEALLPTWFDHAFESLDVITLDTLRQHGGRDPGPSSDAF